MAYSAACRESWWTTRGSRHEINPERFLASRRRPALGMKPRCEPTPSRDLSICETADQAQRMAEQLLTYAALKQPTVSTTHAAKPDQPFEAAAPLST